MSPEQTLDAANVGPPSDIYSLGAMLYVILLGRTAFTGDDRADLLERVRQSDFPAPRRVRPSTPRPLEAICLKAMARDPGARYASAEALADDVDRWLAGDAPTAYRETLPEQAQRWARRHRLLVTIVAATIFVGGVAAAIGDALLFREQKATAAERDRADRNYTLADQTAGELLATIIENPRLQQADFHRTRRDLLRRTVPLYEQLLAQKPEDEKTQLNQAMTLFRLGQIHRELGEDVAALDRMTQARERMESLVRPPTASCGLCISTGTLRARIRPMPI